MPPTRSLRSLALLVFGNAAPSLIALAALPILTRLYTPDAIGQWALFQAALFVPTILSTLRYELAVVVAKEEPEADAVTGLVTCLALASGAVAAGLVGICELLGWLPIGGFDFVNLQCLAAAFLFSGILNVGSAICLRSGTFGLLSAARLAQAVVGVALPIVSFSWLPSSTSLILGTTAGLLFGALFFMGSVLGSLRRLTGKERAFAQVISALKANRGFASFGLPYALVTQTFAFGVTSLLAATKGVYLLGQFNLMSRTLMAPASIVTVSIGQYVARPLAMRDQTEDVGKSLFDLMALLLAASLPLAVLATLYGQPIFTMIFGSGWSQAGLYAEWAAVPMCLHLSIGWTDRLFDAWRRQRFGFYVGSIGCAIWFALLAAAAFFVVSPDAAVIAWCAGLALNATVWIVALARMVGLPRHTLSTVLMIAVVSFMPIWATHAWFSATIPTFTITAVAVATFVTYGALFALIRRRRLDFRLLNA